MSQAQHEFVPVTPGLQEDEISNLFIPNLSKSLGGRNLEEAGYFLALTAAEVFLRQPDSERGIIVGGDTMRQPGAREPSRTMLSTLVREGVPAKAIFTTATGVDPVTSFMRAQELFNEHSDNGPVGIVAAARVWPIHRHIAERTMLRDHGGLLVSGLTGEKRMVGRFDAPASRYVAAGQNPRNPDLPRALRRAKTAQRVLHLSGARFYGS
jgi:hypothetical protein